MDGSRRQRNLGKVDDLESWDLGHALVDRESGMNTDPTIDGVVVIGDRPSSDLHPGRTQCAEQFRIQRLNDGLNVGGIEAGADSRGDGEVDSWQMLGGDGDVFGACAHLILQSLDVGFDSLELRGGFVAREGK